MELNESLLALLKDSSLHLGLFAAAVLLLLFVGRAIPAKRLFWLLIVPIPLALVSFLLPANPLGLVVLDAYNLGVVLLCLVDRFLLTVSPHQVEGRRQIHERFSIHQPNPVLLTLINSSDHPLRCQLADQCPDELLPGLGEGLTTPRHLLTVPAHGTAAVEYTLRPSQRGCYAFGKLYFKYLSRLGLLWVKKTGARPETVQVYPDLVRIKQIQLRYSVSLHGGAVERKHLGQEGTQFIGLRSYVVGDDPRKMDWKATARLDFPIVRTYSNEVDQPILILLDAGRKMAVPVHGLAKFDWALNAALAFAGVSLSRGDQVGVGVFHQDVVAHVPMRAGGHQMSRLLDALHAVQPAVTEPDYERMLLQFARHLKRRAMVVVFTDLVDPMTSRSLMKSLKVFAAHHLLVLVTLADSDLAALAEAMPETVAAAYEKGVAMDLLAQRRKALMALSQTHGAVIVDAPPEQLDEALINQYLRLKLKNRI